MTFAATTSVWHLDLEGSLAFHHHDDFISAGLLLRLRVRTMAVSRVRARAVARIKLGLVPGQCLGLGPEILGRRLEQYSTAFLTVLMSSW